MPPSADRSRAGRDRSRARRSTPAAIWQPNQPLLLRRLAGAVAPASLPARFRLVAAAAALVRRRDVGRVDDVDGRRVHGCRRGRRRRRMRRRARVGGAIAGVTAPAAGAAALGRPAGSGRCAPRPVASTGCCRQRRLARWSRHSRRAFRHPHAADLRHHAPPARAGAGRGSAAGACAVAPPRHVAGRRRLIRELPPLIESDRAAR